LDANVTLENQLHGSFHVTGKKVIKLPDVILGRRLEHGHQTKQLFVCNFLSGACLDQHLTRMLDSEAE